MIQLIKYPQPSVWPGLLQRTAQDSMEIRPAVDKILYAVKEKKDEAVKELTSRLDKITMPSFEVPKQEWDTSGLLSNELKEAINIAINNIGLFHAAQKEQLQIIETFPGIKCWRKSVAIEKVGLYIPGGTAPLFSTLLMLAIPAKIAGCREITVCTPPDNTGNVHPAILYTAQKTGVSRLFKIGGAQAIAAMAYGTETIPQVYKIFGPGNQYVTTAKMLLAAEGFAIDMPAGPSELAIIADDTCVPEYVAADLLSQAEHGADSQVLLISTDEDLILKITQCIELQLQALPRKSIAQQALINSIAILVKDIDEGVSLLNAYAPEHLIIACRDDEKIAEKIVNAGSVFLGNYSPESVGDYASGTNHTLPTNGYAKAYSGVSLDSFFKKITFQKLTQQGLKNIGNTITELALAEGLEAHANAITIRTK
ncbi:MAG TPA: histidinol dehydrogenase [Flavipsychrobacter sp.]|nr:histidinol dehydrogenase [Flavipsychrobacter sp.]